ncbi:MAG: universal stress protein [Synechococcales cyanobacterium K44_A2020_017]|jgi:nucleotide-binding universal stress UspA family protein|nr:universal stress protein [Synechococcales cyanobacterium K32_A2020_035]MBF2094215.1 universal stress protein [Synechococcales cyanobacterium K44_A2020_017]
MFQKILVAVDCSEMGRHVFNHALSLAKPIQAELLLLHVLTAEESGSPDMFVSPGLSYYPVVNDAMLKVYREQWQEFEERGLNMLRSLSDVAQSHGVTTTYRQIPGSPGRIICSMAEENGVDLVIMGRRGLSAIREMLMGSVSNYVLHHAPCSTLTIQVPEDGAAKPSDAQETAASR